MEKDNLKEYIEQHRSDFDDVPVPQNILPEIIHRLRKRNKRKMRSIYYWGVAACVAAILFFSYQFLFQEPGTITTNPPAAAHKQNTIEIPPLTANPESLKAVSQASPIALKKMNVKKNYNPYRKIYEGLRDSSSVARRIEAVMAISDKAGLNHKLSGTLIDVLNTDESSNVRLAALNVLLKYAGDSLVEKQLIRALGNQKDPVIQMELVRVAESNGNFDATKTLMEVADDPYTIPAVREQAFYALMARQ